VACLRLSASAQADATHRQGFRRVQDYQHLAELIAALEQHQKNTKESLERLEKAA
jgi:hypothetical protein